MDTYSLQAQLEAAVDQQLAVAGHDPAVEAAAEALLGALRPALQRLGVELAEQAAAEIGAQLQGFEIDVVVSGGEPSLQVRGSDEGAKAFVGESVDARLTLRLPESLKAVIEEAAADAGDSINTFVVKSLSARARAKADRRGRRVRGTIQT